MNKELKAKLDALVERFNTPAFIDNDPVKFPRMFTERQDIEVAAFLCALIAWGNRKQILNGCQKMLFDIMEGQPYDFVMGDGWRTIDPEINIHRTFFGRDLQYMCKGLQWAFNVSNEWDSLEFAFAGQPDMWKGIETLRSLFIHANDGKPSKHLSNPAINRHKGGSACKRFNLMLRWLVRADGIVDIGIWHDVKPSSLFIPLDVHVGRIGRELGLLARKQDDRLAVEELTDKLRDFDIQDPCKYDFALFGYGESLKHKQP